MAIEGAASARANNPVWPIVAAAILIAAFAVQIPLVLNPDLAWLLTVGERMIEGQRLSVDVFELNPPASVLIYMPAAFLGLHTPVAPEIWVIAQTLAFALGSAYLTIRILGPELVDPKVKARAFVLLLAVLALGPLTNFAEREHIICIGLLPFVALASRFGQADAPSRRLALLAGVFAGISVCIKFYSAPIAAIPLAWNALSKRNLRALFGIESWAAAAVVLTYFLCVMIDFPDYVNTYPKIIALAYLPFRQPLLFMLVFGLGAFALLFSLTLFLTRGVSQHQWRGAGVWVGAALGGALSYLAQGKGFGYVQVPMVLFALIAIVMSPAVLHSDTGQAISLSRRALAIFFAVEIALLPRPAENRAAEFMQPIQSLGLPHPTILAVTDAGEIGQPLTRKLGGTWASGKGSLLEAAGAMYRQEKGNLTPSEAALAANIVADARLRLRNDLRHNRPDVLLVDSERFHAPFDWLGWMRRDAATAHELDSRYRWVRTLNGVSIWIRH